MLRSGSAERPVPPQYSKREGAEDPGVRVRDRPRLPLRLHPRLVAAVEGAVPDRRRPDRHAVPWAPNRFAVVADGTQPPVPRGRALRGYSLLHGEAPRRPLSAPSGTRSRRYGSTRPRG